MGLYSNIAKKRARIKAGSGEKMRKPGTKGAPTASAFKKAAKTAKKKVKKLARQWLASRLKSGQLPMASLGRIQREQSQSILIYPRRAAHT